MDVPEAPCSSHGTLKRKRSASDTTPKIQGPIATIDLKGPLKGEYGKTARLVAKCNIGTLDASYFAAKWQFIKKGKVEDLDLSLDKFNGSSTDLKKARLIIKDTQSADKGTYQFLLYRDNHYISSQFVLYVHMKLGPIATIDLKGPLKGEYGKTACLVAKCNIGTLDASYFAAEWQFIKKGKVEDLDLSLDKFNGSSTDLKKARLIIKDTQPADKGTYQFLLYRGNHYISSQFVLNVHMKLDEKNKIRYKLLNDKGTEALKCYFDTHVPPSQLSVHLLKYRSDLKFKWDCKYHQMMTLFPVGKAVSSNEFDISLLYKLCRNTLGISPPQQGWNVLPNPGDITESDDIERIHQHRNKFSHMGQEKIKNFNKEFKDLSEAIVRLGGKRFKQEVKRVKNLKIDDEENIRIQNIEDKTSQSLEILQSMKKKTEETRTRKSSRIESPFLLCKLYKQRICKECGGNFDRPIRPPKDFIFRRHIPKDYFSVGKRQLRFIKAHYHVECVDAKESICKIPPKEGISLSKAHLEYFESLGHHSLCEWAKKLDLIAV